ncbi:hypothetical protein QCN29_02230 [Streptomyces sp. HNM0663]|uniref:Uncharacterized protein n=1 Tax=Streptomyces chengmaiensis TaxID=3040919 RepID=A0ABT6HG16_9ACTN|nr:hypothetical protein [Streptomyces chengmaiensis]MDH2387623.1 hypothetical protein [Streptomyces chengmaiensis]
MPGISEEWAVQDFVIRAVSLISADRFWTQALSRQELTREEIGELAHVGNSSILDAWLHISDGEILQPVLKSVVSRSEHAADAFTRLAQGESGEAESRLQRLASRDGFESSMSAAFSNLMTLRHQEAEVLTDKIKNLEDGNWVPGDLTPQAACALILAASGAAAVLGDLTLASYLLGVYAAMGCGS